MPKNGNGNGGSAVVKASSWSLFKTQPKDALDLVRMNFEGSGIGPFDLDRVKIPSGGQKVWLVDTAEGQKAVEELEGIVLLAHDTRSYWRDNDVTGNPPDCYSPDCISGRGARSDEEEESDVHDCSECPLSQWGSGKRGRGQVCGVKKRVFMLTSDSVNPIPTALFLPATSLKGARKYFLRLLKGGVNYWDVVTRWRLEPDKDPEGNPYSRAVPFTVKDGRLTKKQSDFIEGLRKILVPILKATPLQEFENGET